MAGSGRIKGKQIVDNSVDIKKLSSGIKLLPSDAKLGINKTPAQITDPKEYVTKEYIDSISEDVDGETIIEEVGILKVNIKDVVDSDEIAIVVDGTFGLHLDKVDISSTIVNGLGLNQIVDIDGVKTFDVKASSVSVIDEIDVKFGSNGNLTIDKDELSNTFLNKVSGVPQTITSDVTFNGDVLSTKTKESFGNDQEFVSKAYVDALAQGLDWKESVLIASDLDLTTGWIYTVDPSGVTGGFKDTLVFSSGVINSSDIDSGSVDVLVIGTRILIKDQINPKQNGIYVVSTSDTLTRASDQDGEISGEISSNNAVFVESGTYVNTGWLLTGVGELVPNIDDLDWIQFSGAGSIVDGAGLVKTGDTFDVDIATNGGLRFDIGGASGKLSIDSKTPTSSEIGIQLVGGVHLLKSEISSTVISGNALTDTIDVDGVKTFNVDAIGLAGQGLSSSTGTSLDINVDDSTIEIDADILQIKALGINNTHIDYGTSGDQVNAGSIPTTPYTWLGTSLNGADIQDILQTLDSDIQSIGGATTASNGLNKNINDIQLGGDLTSNVVIGGDAGGFGLTINEMDTIVLATNSGYNLSMNGAATFTDTTNTKGIEYATDYSANFTDNSLISKKYVDDEIAIATTSGHTQWESEEITGFLASDVTGNVSYLGTITFTADAMDEAQVFINGLRLDVPSQAYFDTIGNSKPSIGSTLFFDLTALGYEIEIDDCIVVTYLVEI